MLKLTLNNMSRPFIQTENIREKKAAEQFPTETNFSSKVEEIAYNLKNASVPRFLDSQAVKEYFMAELKGVNKIFAKDLKNTNTDPALEVIMRQAREELKQKN